MPNIDQYYQEVKLPEGKTCASCHFFRRCAHVLGCTAANRKTCDFYPSRYKGPDADLGQIDINGKWPADDLRRAFVAGASWWQYKETSFTMFPSERDQAEAEAERRYPGGKWIKQMTIKEWEAEGERRFGTKDKREWAFICPSCGYVAKVKDWLEAGGPENGGAQAAFSCIGRLLGSKKTMFDKTGGPCNYAGGGLFKINPMEITFENGDKHRYFDFAPEQPATNEK